MKQYYIAQEKEIFSFNYLQPIADITGLSEVFPNSQRSQEEQMKEDCFHEEAHQRAVTWNGVNDEVYYRHCLLQPAPKHQPQRLTGR